MKFEDFPDDLNLRQYSVKELKTYAKGFLAEKEDRLEGLIERVSSDLDIDRSMLDFSDQSLAILTLWFNSKIEFVKLTQEEYDIKRASFPEYIKIDDVKYSQDTFSLIYEVGMYFGETIIHKYPQLKWEQIFRKTVDYGHVVIMLGKLPMNPCWLMGNLCWGKFRRNEEPKLLELFKIWERYL